METLPYVDTGESGVSVKVAVIKLKVGKGVGISIGEPVGGSDCLFICLFIKYIKF